MRFKLLSGVHTEGHQETYKQYERGDVIETDVDLVKKFNRPGSTKFERVEDNASLNTDEFSAMTVAELRAFAEGEEIDLGEISRKSDILDALRKATV